MKKQYAALKTLVQNIRRDQSEGVVLNNGFELQLLTSGGTRQFDTNAIINRYDSRIAMTVLADFILLGHQKVGSFALSSDKTELFAMAIGAYLDIICEEFNNKAIPLLIDINGDHFKGITDYPRLTHGDIEDPNLTEVSAFIKDMTGIGVIIPDDALEDYVRRVGHLPSRVEYVRGQEDDKRRQARTGNALSNDSEPPDDEIPDDTLKAARRRLGRGTGE